jgi:hypothetical protein
MKLLRWTCRICNDAKPCELIIPASDNDKPKYCPYKEKGKGLAPKWKDE